mgnify:CR=1 FL=1
MRVAIVVAVIAVASLVIGNLAALVQTNVKRILAYSSISHAGFMLIAIAASSQLGGRALQPGHPRGVELVQGAHRAARVPPVFADALEPAIGPDGVELLE